MKQVRMAAEPIKANLSEAGNIRSMPEIEWVVSSLGIVSIRLTTDRKKRLHTVIDKQVFFVKLA
jgi:hypothetical protein